MRLVVFLSLGLFFPFGILAQSAFDSVRILKEVEVVSTRKKARTNAVLPLQSMDKATLQKMASLDVSEAVKRFSGVNVKDYGGVGGMKTVSVRSLGATHTGVEYDGILLSDIQHGQIDLGKLSLDGVAQISLSNAQSLSIFKPARNFSSASILSIESEGPDFNPENREKDYHLGLKLMGGSFGLVNPALTYSHYYGEKVYLKVQGEYVGVQGDYPFTLKNGTQTEVLRRTNGDVQKGNLAMDLHTLINVRHKLAAKLYYYGSEAGLPGPVILYAPHSVQRLFDHNFFAQVVHDYTISPAFIQSNKIKYNWAYNRFLDSNSLQGVEDNRYLQQEIYASTSTLFAPIRWKGFSTSMSLDVAYSDLKINFTDFLPPHRTSLWYNWAVKYVGNYIEVMGNLLLSSFWDEREDFSKVKNTFRASPTLAFSVKPFGNPDFSIRFFYKDVFRMPTFNDLYYDRVGNPDLKPEKARQINAGMGYKKDWEAWGFEVGGDFFKNWVLDKILAFPTKNLFVWSVMNVGKVDVTGVDAHFRLHFKFGEKGMASRFGMDFSGNYTFQRSIDVSDEKGRTYGHQIAYTPMHIANMGVGLQMPYVYLNYQCLYNGSRYALNENISGNLMPAYWEHSIGVRAFVELWKMKWEIGLDFLNFTGKDYEIVRYYPMPKENFRLHLRWNF